MPSPRGGTVVVSYVCDGKANTRVGSGQLACIVFGSCTKLLVDDYADAREQLREALEENGYPRADELLGVASSWVGPLSSKPQ